MIRDFSQPQRNSNSISEHVSQLHFMCAAAPLIHQFDWSSLRSLCKVTYHLVDLRLVDYILRYWQSGSVGMVTDLLFTMEMYLNLRKQQNIVFNEAQVTQSLTHESQFGTALRRKTSPVLSSPDSIRDETNWKRIMILIRRGCSPLSFFDIAKIKTPIPVPIPTALICGSKRCAREWRHLLCLHFMPHI